jgi:hypothetical protein
MPPDILPLDAFVRAVGANRSIPHALFLGAGASVTSGMPSAQMCIWEWKRNIFLTNNVGLESQFSELTLSSVQLRIQRWLDQQGLYPQDQDPSEYGVYVDACYPIPESRRLFFQEKVRQTKPHIGYQLVGELASQRIIRSVWTTNFDQLTSRALASQQVTPIEVGLDSSHRVVRMPNSGELLVVSLHGDYRYDALKNTSEELRTQEVSLERSLMQELSSVPVVVSGYSGRDESIMRCFTDAYSRPGSGTLYWTVHDACNVSPSVKELIQHARSHGRSAYLVPSQGFDDLMVRLCMHCLDQTGQQRTSQLISRNVCAQVASRAAFRVDSDHPTAILKSNAFEIECPSEAIAIELKAWPSSAVWSWIREKTKGKEVVAVPFKGQVFALGTIDDVRTCFGDDIKGLPQRTPLASATLRYEDGAIVSLFRESLIRSIVNATGLQSDGSRELWNLNNRREEVLHGESFSVYDSVHLSLRQIDARTHLILKPSLKVLTRTGELAPRQEANTIKLRILGYQHNKEFNDAVNGWRHQLFNTDSPQKVYEYPPSCGSAFRFQIRKSPVFSEIFGRRESPIVQVQPKFRPLLKQAGLEIGEPALLFSSRSGTHVARDPHPVRGILNNRPFDFPLTRNRFSSEIRLGIVCPKAETRLLQAYLQNASAQIAPSRHEADYLPAFPGVQKAFGVDFVVADPGSNGWAVCQEPAGADDHANAIEVARAINRGIDMLQSSYSPHVILILFPERWSKFRGFTTDTERFDVHDFVKASSVQRGIGTQFLDQSTISDPMQCRVWWWLALAFYVKAMRTPWVLEGLDKDTAFVGLGMSVDATRGIGRHVVMGCSHIYNSRGEGLQYRLSQVENPVFFGKNPFLSRDDARRIGEQIRELFFEARSMLPKRVVIHKRTRFTRDEQNGLCEGLSGVPNVEMLEVVVDDTLRYIASNVDSQGSLHEDNYPVRRGTVVRLDDFSALLWVHGVTSAISVNRRYYQGKRRIPAPLLLRRHCGVSDLRELAEEILGLSKMNWNTFDLYTKLPATVQSSNEIARIGSLLQSFHPRAYDFRLFI